MHEDGIKVRGDVVVKILDANDHEIDRQEHQNIVVKGGKRILAHLLAQQSDVHGIDRIGYGTSNTAATVNDASLTGTVFKEATPIVYALIDTAYNQVMFSAVLGTSDGNGQTYNEIGLFSATEGTLFSRLVISPIVKSMSYKIQVDWVISFQ